MNYYIAIDVGGTQLRAACYPENSIQPVNVKRISTHSEDQPPLERLIALIHCVWPDSGNVTAIAVTVPGPVDPYQGIVFLTPNIPGWVNLPLRRILEEQFKAPVALGNDANLAALAEWKYGAGQGYQHLIYITVSTGIGAGVIENGRLILGKYGLAAELGHITVLPNGPICSCGQRGHLEAVASGPAIARWVEGQIANGAESSLKPGVALSGRDVGEAALRGDALAIQALSLAGSFLGRAIADFLHIFNPSAIIIGGGVSKCGDFLFQPMKTALRERVFSPQYLADLVIKTAALGDDIGLMGALALASDMIKM